MLPRRIAAILVAGALGAAAHAQNIAGQVVASGLTKPVMLTHAPGDYARLFVAEQRGVVKLIKNGVLQSTPFLDIDSAVPEQTYSGMLGIAFHPDYATNGRFYIHHTTGGTSAIVVWIVEYTRSATNPDQADPASRRVILKLASPSSQGFHLGGWIGFGPDGKLWIPLGDGGYTGDPSGPPRSQSSTSLWGKLLRIDVDHDDFPADADANYAIPADNPYATSATVAHEVFLRGLRNPYRASFDTATGDLWIGDVGGTSREEIDRIRPDFDGGANLGWNCMEGLVCASNANCTCPANLITPVYDYAHTVGLCVTGGTVYHGCAMPALDGTYFFGDYQNSKLFSFKLVNGAVTGFVERTSQMSGLSTPVCIGTDALGEMYVVEHTVGRIRRIVGNPLPTDSDGNGVPDTCEPPLGDINGDHRVDGADLGILLGGWGQGGVTDLNRSGTTDGADLGLLLGNWGASN
ncbi:MAG: PQQ-dependent sugar dehydrogenase [Phycisphaerales bacterium]